MMMLKTPEPVANRSIFGQAYTIWKCEFNAANNIGPLTKSSFDTMFDWGGKNPDKVSDIFSRINLAIATLNHIIRSPETPDSEIIEKMRGGLDIQEKVTFPPIEDLTQNIPLNHIFLARMLDRLTTRNDDSSYLNQIGEASLLEFVATTCYATALTYQRIAYQGKHTEFRQTLIHALRELTPPTFERS